jgi:hypothetical protein
MSRDSESIKELRIICQESRYNDEGGMHWFERNFYRRISIYFTKIFLKIGISANQATLLSLISALFGGLFLIFATNILYLFISALFFILCLVLDRVDGEIARYNKSTSKFGKHFDFMVGTFVHAYILACMTFGAYNVLHDPTIFAFGFLAVTLNLLEGISSLDIIYRIPYWEGESQDISGDASDKKGFIVTHVYSPVRRVNNFLGPGALMYPILILTALDIYFAPVSLSIPIIGLFVVNARYAFLIVYGVGKLSSFILKLHSIHEKEFGSKQH